MPPKNEEEFPTHMAKTREKLIYSACQDAPSHACVGNCQKVWRQGDLPTNLVILANSACPQGGGTLTSNIAPSLYIVISADAGTMNKGGATITNAGST
ncbi:hypothetical protein BKM23_24760 [Pseudomonas syringae pv. syringae]|nr:hypothetical protein BKM23_24760 [Pseudomonas syringae pv. syringae]